jgi:dephospho-CoA kinase
MRKVALTGGIATGKTHVARRLSTEHHIPVIDSDTIVHQALAAGGALVEPVVARFGPGVRSRDGGIDRRALAAIVFKDTEARHALESLVHPHVYQQITDWFSRLDPTAAFAVADIPLLFETGREREFDVVIVTACAPDVQMQRVMERDGATREQAEQRLAAQWPIAKKIERADFVIATDGLKDDTDRQIDQLVTKLRNQG